MYKTSDIPQVLTQLDIGRLRIEFVTLRAETLGVDGVAEGR